MFDALFRIWICNNTASDWSELPGGARGTAGSFGTNYNDDTRSLTAESYLSTNENFEFENEIEDL